MTQTVEPFNCTREIYDSLSDDEMRIPTNLSIRCIKLSSKQLLEGQTPVLLFSKCDNKFLGIDPKSPEACKDYPAFGDQMFLTVEQKTTKMSIYYFTTISSDDYTAINPNMQPKTRVSRIAATSWF